MQIGTIAIWDTSSNMSKSHKKIKRQNPDYLMILGSADDNSCFAVPCWISNPGYSISIHAYPQNLYVDAKKIIIVNNENLDICKSYSVCNISESIKAIKDKNQEIKNKKHSEKLKRTLQKKEAARKRMTRRRIERKKAKERKIEIEKTYGQAYDVAVINNNRHEMNKIKEIVGYDPRPKQKGLNNSSKLNKVTNFKPCSGGLVSPK